MNLFIRLEEVALDGSGGSLPDLMLSKGEGIEVVGEGSCDGTAEGIVHMPLPLSSAVRIPTFVSSIFCIEKKLP